MSEFLSDIYAAGIGEMENGQLGFGMSQQTVEI